MSKSVKLSKSAIENIFQLRANGKTFNEIADRYPCSDWYIKQIIDRKKYKDVEIDAALVHGAQNVHVKPKSGDKRKPRKKNGTTRHSYTCLAKLMKASHDLSEAYEECLKDGMSKEFVQLAMEQAGGESLFNTGG